MSGPKELPECWKWVRIGDVLKFTGGGTPSKTEKSYWNGNVHWASVKDIKGNYLSDTEDRITKKGVENSSVSIAYPGEVILITRISPGKVIITNIETAINQDLKIVRAKSDYLEKFLVYYFANIEQTIISLSSGTTVKGITLNNLNEIKIPVISLAQQNILVSKLDELFSEVNKGEENLKIAQQQLKIYRRSILKSAFEGRFTNENTVYEKYPENWKTTTLIENCLKIQDGSHFSPPIQFDEPGYNRFKYITAKNIRNDYMDFRKLTYVNKDFHESIYNRCNPEYGDVLLTKDGVNTGEVTLNQLREPFSLLSSVCLFKTKKDILNNEYLKYFIQSPLGAKAIQNSMTGTAIKRIVLRKIKDSFFPLPKLNEQIKIVAAIETRLSVINKIEEDIVKNLKLSDLLKQSIMRKAFEGKLNYE